MFPCRMFAQSSVKRASTEVMESHNLARRLSYFAREAPDRVAIIAPAGRDKQGRPRTRQVTFAELDEQTDRIAAGLLERGLKPGMKLVLFVPFSIEFISLTFALLKSRATLVLIDPGMGRTNIFRCLNDVQPDGFIAIPVVHLVRWVSGGAVRRARFNVCVGPRLPGTIASLKSLLRTRHRDTRITPAAAEDPAAIIFTSGSTGPPKGVLYEHGMFDAQVDLIQSFYGIKPGEVDLPGFPLFGLFNAAMGVTTVIPDMDPTRPAEVDPIKILEAIHEHRVTQAFGSPAFWNRVGRHCIEHNERLPGLKRALSAGGPVPPHVLERMSRVLTGPAADLMTPYGATESLPVASIGAKEILESKAPVTRQGGGTCVGRTFPGIDVRIIEMTDGPIASWADVRECPPGEIGEIVVRGPSVTREYFNQPEATRLAKIPDVASPTSPGDGQRRRGTFWHRIGDVGRIDEDGLLWFCGRKAHVVEADGVRMFSVCCEAIFNEHPRIYRTALVGIGEKPRQRPLIVAEPEAGEFPESESDRDQLKQELLDLGANHAHTANIREILFHPSLPVDTRHNVKINREALAGWAAERMSGTR